VTRKRAPTAEELLAVVGYMLIPAGLLILAGAHYVLGAAVLTLAIGLWADLQWCVREQPSANASRLLAPPPMRIEGSEYWAAVGTSVLPKPETASDGREAPSNNKMQRTSHG
jgi:hypothetical protein